MKNETESMNLLEKEIKPLIVVYDCEIVKCIPSANKDLQSKYEYCEGWSDFAGMGISCVGVFTNWNGEYRVFSSDSSELKQIFQKDWLFVGFNNINFDNNLLRANGFDVDDDKCFDILRYIWNADGLGNEFDASTHQNYGLDAVAKSNGFGGKSGSGAKAPQLWQDGKFCEVIDYCLHDVALTWQIYTKLTNPCDGGLVHPFKPKMRIIT